MIPFLGFAPDADPYIEGVITECTDMVPVVDGYKTAPTLTATDYTTALDNTCLGSAITLKLDGTYRLFAGIDDTLYEGSGGTWTDKSKSANAYSCTTRWRFGQFGDDTIAVNKADTPQLITSGNFADLSGSPPKASLIETVKGFVMLADTNDGVYGDQPDRWWCSALYDNTSWTPAISTQATTGRLVESAGKITALKRLGNDIVAYKEHSMFVGRYVGPPEVWRWEKVRGEQGTPVNEAVVDIGGVHLFIGYDDIWSFDGASIQPLGNDVKQWFFSNMDKEYRASITAAHDHNTSTVYWFYPSSASGTGALDCALIYNYKSGKWGHGTYAIEMNTHVIQGDLTYDDLGDFYSTYDDLTGLTYDSPFFQQSAPILSAFKTDHKLYSMTGAGNAMQIRTGNFGDDNNLSLFQRIRPRFVMAPTSATMTNHYGMITGDALTEDATTTMVTGKFDFLRSARWHCFDFTFNGDCIVTGFSPDVEGAGLE